MTGGMSAKDRTAWYAVLSMHVTWLVWTGLIKGLGVMLPIIQKDFASKTWLVGWIIAIITGVCDFVGIFAGPLEARFGTRIVVMVSGLLIGVSLITASMATTVVQFAVCLTLLSGPGLSFANILTRAMIGRYFTTGYATANGIGHAGHSVALIVFAPLTQLFLETYGWRGATMLLGGICMHLVPCGALLSNGSTNTERNSRDDYTTVPVESEAVDDPGEDAASHDASDSKCCGLELGGVCSSQAFGFKVVLKVSFWLTAIIFICNRLVNDLWVIYFVDHAYAKGFSGQEAVTFTAVAGVANLIFKIGHGPLVDKGWVGIRPMMALFIAVAAACLFVDQLMNSYWLMMANAFFFMGSSGAIGSLGDIYTKDMLGADHLVSAFSWMGVLSGFATCGLGFLPGWMFDMSGSYDGAFILMGCVWSMSLVAMFVEWVMHRCGWNTRDAEMP